MSARVLASMLVLFVAAMGIFIVFAARDVKQQQRVERKTTAQRVLEGPRIVTTKPLSSTEDLSLVVIPSEFGEPLDVKCFIYKNREFNQVTFTCPDARQDEIAIPEAEGR